MELGGGCGGGGWGWGVGGGGFLGVEGRGGEEEDEGWRGETHGGIRVADFGGDRFVIPPMTKRCHEWGTQNLRGSCADGGRLCVVGAALWWG